MRILIGLLKYSLILVGLIAVAGLAFYATIRVVTSKESVAVPNLIGVEMTEAMRALEAVGLRISLDDDDRNSFDQTIPAGHVLRQSPAAGSVLKADRKVRVVLSLGSRDVYVPRLVGERVTSAQMRVHEAGLRLGDMVYVSSPVVPADVVVDQEPPTLRTGGDGRVNLLVSAGASPQAYVMPDVFTRAAADVKVVLERAGFRVRIESEPYDGIPAGTVVRQKPLSGYMVQTGDMIWLWASRPTSRAPLP